MRIARRRSFQVWIDDFGFKKMFRCLIQDGEKQQKKRYTFGNCIKSPNLLKNFINHGRTSLRDQLCNKINSAERTFEHKKTFRKCLKVLYFLLIWNLDANLLQNWRVKLMKTFIIQNQPRLKLIWKHFFSKLDQMAVIIKLVMIVPNGWKRDTGKWKRNVVVSKWILWRPSDG